MRRSSKLAVLLAVLTASSARAATLIPVVPVPGSTVTAVNAINDNNIIVGTYEMADGIEHGFYGTLAGDYTTFDFDAINDSGTVVRDIDNRGDMTGTANLTQQDTLNLVEFERFANGSMKLIETRHKPLHGVAGGISPKKGTFAAENWNEDLTTDGFLGRRANAKTELELGFTATKVRPRDVADSGDVVGYYKTTGGYQGFLLRGGTVTTLNYPDANAASTLPQGVNPGQMITGYWQDADFNEFAFIYDEKKATYTPITVPGFPNSTADGINRAGLIAVQGYSSDFTATAAYIYCPKKKSKCPAGGAEIADAKPVRVPAGGIVRRVPPGAPKPLTPAHAAVLLRQ